MDDLAHQCPSPRKRKQDQDDCQDIPAAADSGVEQPVPPSSCNPPNTPRRPWLAEADDNWTSPTSPQVSSPLNAASSSRTKRPRLDTLDTKRRARSAAAHHKILPSPLTSARQGSDIEDIGIVSTADPGPSSGSLLRGGHRPAYESYLKPPDVDQDAESPVIDFSSPHIPPLRPLINRSTLKELELDIILRNPVIRHDLLFDPGLQFRPRRKRERFERYWSAVWEEIQTGCTCVTMDVRENTLHPKICVCARHRNTNNNSCTSPLSAKCVPEQCIPGVEHLYTIRPPSRIPALLEEFLEVMVFVIQPLSNTAVYTDPTAIREQAQEHSAHAAHLRAIFDPELIAQELRHGVFDPAGLFRQIGDTLKHHCAPMRDGAVEEMVRLAQRPGLEAFKAVRTCLELLELMKLDIANHQLTQLRPWLLRNTGIFEVKAFKIRFGANASLHNTRRWLHSAHQALLERTRPIFHPAFLPTGSLRYTEMRRNQQIYLAALKGIVDLIFDAQELYPSSSNFSHSNSNSPPLSPVSPSSPSTPTSPATLTPTSLPETLYLDKARILPLSQEAASATALYMFMLLFRQLVFSPPSEAQAVSAAQLQSDMGRLKRELRDIGPACLGVCFEAPSSPSSSEVDSAATLPSPSPSPSPSPLSSSQSLLPPKESRDLEQLREVKEGLVLQIAKRACDTRRRAATGSFALHSTSTSDMGIGAGDAPDPGVLGVARRWADANMQAGSALAALVHRRMRDAVFDAVVCLAYPSASTSTSTTSIFTSLAAATAPAGAGSLGVDLSATSTSTAAVGSVVQAAGMDAVADEIRRLAEDTARLALIHLNTHLPLYEGQGFLPTAPSLGESAVCS